MRFAVNNVPESGRANRALSTATSRNKALALPGALLLTLLVGGSLLLAAFPDNAQGRSETAIPAGTQPKEAFKTEDGRYSMTFYQQGVRGTMFTPPSRPLPKPPPPVKKPAPPKIVTPPVKVEEPNPFQDWSYTGTVKQGSQMLALVENTKTKEGQYVRIGETLLGHQVTAITDQSIAFAQAGKSRALAKSSTLTLTPLTANAAYLGGGGAPPGAPGQPGQPNMPGGMPMGGAPMPMNMPVQTMSFPTGLPMELKAQMMNNMDNSFIIRR